MTESSFPQNGEVLHLLDEQQDFHLAVREGTEVLSHPQKTTQLS